MGTGLIGGGVNMVNAVGNAGVQLWAQDKPWKWKTAVENRLPGSREFFQNKRPVTVPAGRGGAEGGISQYSKVSSALSTVGLGFQVANGVKQIKGGDALGGSATLTVAGVGSARLAYGALPKFATWANNNGAGKVLGNKALGFVGTLPSAVSLGKDVQKWAVATGPQKEGAGYKAIETGGKFGESLGTTALATYGGPVGARCLVALESVLESITDSLIKVIIIYHFLYLFFSLLSSLSPGAPNSIGQVAGQVAAITAFNKGDRGKTTGMILDAMRQDSRGNSKDGGFKGWINRQAGKAASSIGGLGMIAQHGWSKLIRSKSPSWIEQSARGTLYNRPDVKGKVKTPPTATAAPEKKESWWNRAYNKAKAHVSSKSAPKPAAPKPASKKASPQRPRY